MHVPRASKGARAGRGLGLKDINIVAARRKKKKSMVSERAGSRRLSVASASIFKPKKPSTHNTRGQRPRMMTAMGLHQGDRVRLAFDPASIDSGSQGRLPGTGNDLLDRRDGARGLNLLARAACSSCLPTPRTPRFDSTACLTLTPRPRLTRKRWDASIHHQPKQAAGRPQQQQRSSARKETEQRRQLPPIPLAWSLRLDPLRPSP